MIAIPAIKGVICQMVKGTESPLPAVISIGPKNKKVNDIANQTQAENKKRFP